MGELQRASPPLHRAAGTIGLNRSGTCATGFVLENGSCFAAVANGEGRSFFPSVDGELFTFISEGVSSAPAGSMIAFPSSSPPFSSTALMLFRTACKRSSTEASASFILIRIVCKRSSNSCFLRSSLNFCCLSLSFRSISDLLNSTLSSVTTTSSSDAAGRYSIVLIGAVALVVLLDRGCLGGDFILRSCFMKLSTSSNDVDVGTSLLNDAFSLPSISSS